MQKLRKRTIHALQHMGTRRHEPTRMQLQKCTQGRSGNYIWVRRNNDSRL